MRVLQVRSALQSLIYIVNYGLLALAYQPGSGRIVTITGSVALPIPMLQTIVRLRPSYLSGPSLLISNESRHDIRETFLSRHYNNRKPRRSSRVPVTSQQPIPLTKAL
ncbi:hypothetical protein B0T09DRAFT_123712 [Sordaria sp. MPI-SDFR-AT-0083]|nr:hypothetical protein B0T09DRAFT_123712 [Sordaria sp. MPI-SDFR-AT-0083]